MATTKITASTAFAQFLEKLHKKVKQKVETMIFRIADLNFRASHVRDIVMSLSSAMTVVAPSSSSSSPPPPPPSLSEVVYILTNEMQVNREVFDTLLTLHTHLSAVKMVLTPRRHLDDDDGGGANSNSNEERCDHFEKLTTAMMMMTTAVPPLPPTPPFLPPLPSTTTTASATGASHAVTISFEDLRANGVLGEFHAPFFVRITCNAVRSAPSSALSPPPPSPLPSIMAEWTIRIWAEVIKKTDPGSDFATRAVGGRGGGGGGARNVKLHRNAPFFLLSSPKNGVHASRHAKFMTFPVNLLTGGALVDSVKWQVSTMGDRFCLRASLHDETGQRICFSAQSLEIQVLSKKQFNIESSICHIHSLYLPVNVIYGIGDQIRNCLYHHGIRTVADLANANPRELWRTCGKNIMTRDDMIYTCMRVRQICNM